MNSIQRHKLKKKVRLLHILAYLIGLGLTAISFLFLVFVIKPIGEPTILYAILLISTIIVPMITGLGLGMFGANYQQIINVEGKRLLTEKSELYYQRFCNLIRFKQFYEARDYYNEFICGHYKVICNGILIGAVLHSGADKNWNRSALDRMMDI